MKYLLNIKTATVHIKGCYHARKIAPHNKKEFSKLEDAINYYDGNTKKAICCNHCLCEENNKTL